MKQCGYTMEYKWKQDVNKNEQSSLEVKITFQAYMDDTTWINHKQVNKTKSVLITNAIKDGSPVTLQFGIESIVIKLCKPNESTRVLGVNMVIRSQVKMLNSSTRSYTVLRDRSSGRTETDRSPRDEDRIKTEYV